MNAQTMVGRDRRARRNRRMCGADGPAVRPYQIA